MPPLPVAPVGVPVPRDMTGCLSARGVRVADTALLCRKHRFYQRHRIISVPFACSNCAHNLGALEERRCRADLDALVKVLGLPPVAETARLEVGKGLSKQPSEAGRVEDGNARALAKLVVVLVEDHARQA